MSNPLRLLSKLRRYGDKAVTEDYLKKEYRQNLKAIEDAFRNLGVSLESINSDISSLNAATASVGAKYAEGPTLTTDSTSSTSFVAMSHTVSIASDGSPILIVLQGKEWSGIYAPFSVSTNGSSQMYLDRDGTTNMGAHSLSTAAIARTDIPIVWLDPAPPTGTVTYTVYARVTGAGSVTIANARLVASRF